MDMDLIREILFSFGISRFTLVMLLVVINKKWGLKLSEPVA